MDDGADVRRLKTEDFVWIKRIYEHSKLTKISTVWKSRIVQNEVYTRKKHLSFNTKKQCANNALCFFLFA